MFFCEFCEIFKNNFFTEHLWATASVLSFFYFTFLIEYSTLPEFRNKRKELACTDECRHLDIRKPIKVFKILWTFWVRVFLFFYSKTKIVNDIKIRIYTCNSNIISSLYYPKKERKTIKIHYFCQMLLRIKETQFDRPLQLGPEDYFM